MNETLTPIEAGLYLNPHVRTIHRLAKNGLIPALKVGGRWRFNKAVLGKWLLEDSARRRGCVKAIRGGSGDGTQSEFVETSGGVVE